MLQRIIHWIELHQQPCLYKKIFGFDCPGCGMQTSFIELLKGNFIESIYLYPGLLPTIFLLLYFIFHIIFNFEHGAKILKYTFIIIFIINLLFYLYKIIFIKSC